MLHACFRCEGKENRHNKILLGYLLLMDTSFLQKLCSHRLCGTCFTSCHKALVRRTYRVFCLFITPVDMFRYEKHQGNIMHSWIVIINPTCCMWRDLEVNVTLPYLMKSGYREYPHGKGWHKHIKLFRACMSGPPDPLKFTRSNL